MDEEKLYFGQHYGNHNTHLRKPN